MSVTSDRERAVAETISAIRDIEDQQGVTRESLDAIRTTLIELANRRELFTEAEFPPRGVDNSFLYTLSEDEDHRFTLYLNSSACHVETPPHNHTTWAVVVGVLGDELNRFYRRVDDGSVAGKGEVEQADSFNITAGTGAAMLPDDIHSIHQEGPSLNMHLHMYGRALTEQRERVQYDMDNGTYKVFPPTPGVAK